MEQAEISIAAKEIQTEIELLQEIIETLELKLSQIQNKCQHPNKYLYSSHVGWVCPDCGLHL